MADETKKRSVDVPQILSQSGMGTTADNIDKVFQQTASGPLSSAIGDSFYGINHRQSPNAVQINKDLFGLTFFTRPLMNLSTENLRAIRIMTPLLTQEPASIQRIIRCTLDPSLSKPSRRRNRPAITCPFVDEQQAFIPILTNNLLSMSGWPDVIVPTYTSPEGVYKEAYSMVDGLAINYSTYDITANFRNLPGDPITLLTFIWAHYMALVYEGKLTPYPEFLIENEIDYNTRIYRLVLDATKTRVQKIGACGAAFPLASPIGAAFNFEADRPINQSNDQITIQFRCMGAMYQDDILIDEFNRTVTYFNPSMAEEKRKNHYRKVPIDALGIFNNRGYPWINLNTYELEWWVDVEEYRYRLPMLNQNNR